MASPMEIGIRQPRPEKPDNWKSKEYDQENFGHEAERILIEALKHHPAVEKIERDDYSDEREKTDFFITFKGSEKYDPIRVQFSLRNKTDIPPDVIFVKGDNKMFDKAKKKYEEESKNNPNISLFECFSKRDLSELVGQIFDKLPLHKSRSIMARLKASMSR